MSGPFLRNSWYAAAWSSEVSEGSLAREVLGDPILLFRAEDGRPAALLDQCPHRLLPLSHGTCAKGRVQCGYHGMVFDSHGACVSIPGQDSIPPTARVRSFPVAEKYGLIWVWPGDPGRADLSLLPTVERFGEPGWALLDGGYQYHRSDYRNIIENLMDPSHTTFVHKETIANPEAADKPVQTERLDGGVVAYKWVENSPPTMFDKASRDFGAQNVDRGQFFYYFLPAVSRVDIAVIPAGSSREDRAMDEGLRTFSYKFLTPANATETHFFWLHLRNYRIDDAEFVTRLRGNMEKTFLEDAVIVAAIQKEQTRTGLRQKTGLAIDRGPTMALRLLDRMIADEAAGANAGSESKPAKSGTVPAS